MTWRPATCTALVIAVAALIVGCGDDDASSSATVTPELDACIDPQSVDAESACLDQIERYIEADVAGVEDAVQRVNSALEGAGASSFAFERVTPIGDGYDPVTATEPIELYWKVGTTERTMFVCFGGEVVEVGQDPCTG